MQKGTTALKVSGRIRKIQLPLWASFLCAVLLAGGITLVSLWCQPNALRTIVTILWNKPLLIFYIGYFAVSATNTMQALAIYFARYNLGNEGLTTLLMAVAILPVVVVSMLIPALIKRFGKRRLTIVSSIISIALCVVQYMLGYTSFWLFLGLAAVRVLFMQIPMLMYGMFTADCIEYCAAKTGKRTEGVSFSLQTLMTKLSGSVVSILSLAIMGSFGFVEQAETQTASALEGIWLCMSLLPAAGYVVMLICMLFFYKLNEKDVQEMIENNTQK